MVKFVLAFAVTAAMLCGCEDTQSAQNTSKQATSTKSVEAENTDKEKADKIVKNTKIYTSVTDSPDATAFVIKDGKFIYVGDETGLKDYEGEEVDMGGKFIMPTFMDAHVHLPQSLVGLSFDSFDFIQATNKADCLKHIKNTIDNNPNYPTYTFLMSLASLGGEQLTKEDLDAICADKEIFITEQGGHSS